MKNNLKKEKRINKKLYIILTILIIIMCIILLKVLPFGYIVQHPSYTHYDNKTINLGVPKFSFMMQNKDENYSYKNLRGKTILQNEISEYLKTLKPVTCNDTVYYYDKSTNTTIIDYSVKSNLIYSTISYAVKNGNYCDTFKLKTYENKIGKTNAKVMDNDKIHIDFSYSLNETSIKENPSANLYIYTLPDGKVIENSTGTFEIEGNKLIYTRTDFITNDDEINIPTKSEFAIKKKNLILMDNYLSDYIDYVLLRWRYE